MKKDMEFGLQVGLPEEHWTVTSGRAFFASQIAAQQTIIDGVLILSNEERANGQLGDVLSEIGRLSLRRDAASDDALAVYGVFQKGPKAVAGRLGRIASFLKSNPDKKPSNEGIDLIHKTTDRLDLLPERYDQVLGGVVLEFVEAVNGHPFFANTQDQQSLLPKPRLHDEESSGGIDMPQNSETVLPERVETPHWLVEIEDFVSHSENPVHVSDLVMLAYGTTFVSPKKFKQLKKDLANCPNLKSQPGSHFSLAEAPDHPFLTQLWSAENTTRISSAVLSVIPIGGLKITRIACEIIKTNDENSPEYQMTYRHLKYTLDGMVKRGILVKTDNVYSRMNQQDEQSVDGSRETDEDLARRIHKILGPTNNPWIGKVIHDNHPLFKKPKPTT